MPIKPENRHLYPPDWDTVHRPQALERAGHRCVGSPRYPDCRAENGKPHPVTGSKVVLTVGHRDHDPTNNDPANLAPWCQRCHCTHDAPLHARNAAETRRRKRAQQQPPLPL